MPLRLARGAMPIAVRSVRLLQPDDKYSDEVRLGQWGPYGLLARNHQVPLRLTLHRDTTCDHTLRYLREVLQDHVHQVGDRTIDVQVPVKLVRWVATLDQVRAVELDRDPDAD